MAKNTAINLQTSQLTIDPGASGDSFIKFDIGGTSEWSIGTDDTDSDAYKTSQGAALGTNDAVNISTAGDVRKQLTSAFLSVNNATQANVTGDATVYKSTFVNEVFDQNADFDASSTFTAPVTGRYFLQVVFYLNKMNASMTDSYVDIVTSNATYRTFMMDFSADIGAGSAASDAELWQVNGKAFADMDASDTAFVNVMISGSTKTVEIIGATGGGFRSTAFSGYLVT